MGIEQNLQEHLDSGTTSLCRCWVLRRKDGSVFGFTDHDRDLEFDGVTFCADSGLTAQALQQTTGMSVDNTEALGALSNAAVQEEDILAGLFDGAAVEAWLVNWLDVTQRFLQFRGSIGEVETGAGAFRAELRGLSAKLNVPSQKTYQTNCPLVLGGGQCGVATDQPNFSSEALIVDVRSDAEVVLDSLQGFASEWFDRGRLDVVSGSAAGAVCMIKLDADDPQGRRITLWESLRPGLSVGDRVRVTAGCDKRLETCREKFDNVLNFGGFPHVPGEDWMMSYPVRGRRNNGGKRDA